MRVFEKRENKEDAMKERGDKMYKGMRIYWHSLWHIGEWKVLRLE